MTFCIGIRVDEGIVALADTQIVRGEHTSTKFKLSELTIGDRSALVMTSGLRSVRDKIVARLEDALADGTVRCDRMHQLASEFGALLRTVRDEDEASLVRGGLRFNLHAILAGRLPGDQEPVVLEVFPEGNWVDVTTDAPYFVIGRSFYGKPILDRLLRHNTPIDEALQLAYLAFDATRTSVTDVDFPVDVAVMRTAEVNFHKGRFTVDDLAPVHDHWQSRLAEVVRELPNEWASRLLGSEDPPPPPADSAPNASELP
ncbi:MAG TPA: hypothetical protein VMM60_14715 [Ilumatobacter sp.]|nr:hypothetical protein [Ilumatobacter sp.]